MDCNVIGREREKAKLDEIYNSGKSEFVVVYGRRRVGKTYLVREYFEGKMAFSVAGMSNATNAEQIKNFALALKRYGADVQQQSDWIDLFDALIKYLDTLPVERKVILIDELPWLCSPRSNFLSALENFWNSWVSGRHDIVLIVCGSATSWIMDNLINSHGGLHNRLTHHILLEPFTLYETEEMLQKMEFNLSRYEMAELYMIFGGIPYYISMLNKSLSLAENVDALLFDPRGELYSEFNNLYRALFRKSDDYIKVVKSLSQNAKGLTRQELQDATKLTSGGGLTTIINNLETCGFIRKYTKPGNKVKESVYQLVDFFTLFYFRFKDGTSIRDTKHWSRIQHTAEFYAWAGFSFEVLVLGHIYAIKNKLGISGVNTQEYTLRFSDDEQTHQIDLVIERSDNTINLCEMKFCEAQFVIDKEYEMEIRNRLYAYTRKIARRTQSIQITFVTTFGVKQNSHSSIVQNEVTLEDLFIPKS